LKKNQTFLTSLRYQLQQLHERYSHSSTRASCG
jgi:hypothetical protein